MKISQAIQITSEAVKAQLDGKLVEVQQ